MIDITFLYKKYVEANLTICTDTRKIEQNSLFFCLQGANYDANTFAEQALAQGAKTVVTQRKELENVKGYYYAEDSLKMLQQLALHHRRMFNIPIIAIGGSNGKTTTKELLTNLMQQHFTLLSTPGNFNNHIGVPLTLLQLRPTHQFAIIEMGINHANEMTELCNIAEPTAGLLTNIGKEHLEGLGSIEGVAKAEGELFEYLQQKNGQIFVNYDDEWLKKMSIGIKAHFSYAQKDKDADRLFIPQQLNPNIKFQFEHLGIESALNGDYNFANIITAITVANFYGIEASAIKKGIENYVPNNLRSQWKKTEKNLLLIDCYNANPTSMELAIKNFAATSNFAKTYIVGDMLEMGTYADEEHKGILNLLKKLMTEADKVICIGSIFSQFSQLYPFSFYNNVGQLIETLPISPILNQTVLIKASRGTQLDKIINLL